MLWNRLHHCEGWNGEVCGCSQGPSPAPGVAFAPTTITTGLSCPSGFGRRALVCPWVGVTVDRGAPRRVSSRFEPGSPCRLRSRSIMMCRCNALAMALDSFGPRSAGMVLLGTPGHRAPGSVAGCQTSGRACGRRQLSGSGPRPGGSRRPPPGHVPAARPGPQRGSSACAGLGLGLRAPPLPATRAPAPPYSPSRRFLCGLPAPRLQDRGVIRPLGRILPESGLRGLSLVGRSGADGSAGDGCSWCQTPAMCPTRLPDPARPAGRGPEVGGAGAPPVDERHAKRGPRRLLLDFVYWLLINQSQ